MQHTENDAASVDIGHELSEGFAAKFIRRKAKQVARRPEFSASDVDDIAQDLTVHLLEQFEEFDPAQGHFNVFVTTVVDRYTANIVRDANAGKRDDSGVLSLHTIVGEDEDGPITLGDQLGEDASRSNSPDWESRKNSLELSMDVEHVLSTLSPEDRELCERLKHTTVTELARELGIPRRTIRDRLDSIRERFEDAGFENFF